MTTTSARPPSALPAVPRPRAEISAKTLRTDRWWIAPLLTAAGLIAWLTYATFRVFMQKYYFYDGSLHGQGAHYLTPFYSPCVSNGCAPGSSEFGTFLPNWPIIPFAALSLPFLLLFRLSCYYYRKAYYRAFWFSPPACAVPDGHTTYSGETRFPLIFQNAHRYAFYAAFLISILNTWDAIRAFWSADGFGFGLGNLVLIANVVLLWAYTLSCHSCRHIIGGKLKHFSKHPVRYKAWGFVSKLNGHHMGLAWTTLASLAVADFYVMAVSAGWFSDLRFFN
jgi:hypothetical protein